MSSQPRQASADAALLAALERSFERLAGHDGVIDVQELKAALGLRTEYLARRVMATIDHDRDGVLSKREFVEEIRRLIGGSDREKLYFAFRLYDHDGDGSISFEEMHRMVAMSIAEADVVERPTQRADRLTRSLFRVADKDRDGKLSFEELEAAVRKHPALLQQMTRSEAMWIAPNEELLAWLEGGAGRPRRAWWAPESGWAPVVVLVLWILCNVGILAFALLRGREAEHSVNPLMQWGRALGKCINFNGALLLVPVMRRLLTKVRATFLGRVVPIDDAVRAHRIVGHTLVALGVAHAAALVASYAAGHPQSSVQHFVLLTERGLTGVLLIVVIAVMWFFALAFVRRSSRFELFYFTHLLYLAWFALAIAHSPSFLLWAGGPLLGFLVERVLRLTRRAKQSSIVEARALRSGVTRLEVQRPEGFVYGPGDYAFLRIPAIAAHEWHPFTISSAPESGRLTFHVRSLGNWTAALRRRVEHDELRGASAPLTAYVDGPYGSPSAHIFESRFAVLIGAGIGVTPFASVLESLVLRGNGDRPPRLEKAHFFWLNKDQYSFEWFAALLSELEKSDRRALLDVHLCMTAGRTGATSLALELAREAMHADGRSDLITGLRTRTHMGHPDWERMLGDIHRLHAPAKVDVYFCGPPGLATKIRAVCTRLGMPFREEQF